MNKRITYINPNIKDFTDYNVIIESENNQRTLVKYDENVEQLLKQEELIKKINEEKEKIDNETTLTQENIVNRKYNIKGIITSVLLVLILPTVFLEIMGLNFTFYSPRFNKEFSFATIMTYYFSAISIPTGTISLIYNTIKLKKENKKENMLEIQKSELNNILEKETINFKALEEKVSLEKNIIKLETKSINVTEEFNKIEDNLQSCYTQDYNNKSKNNKKLIKKL